MYWLIKVYNQKIILFLGALISVKRPSDDRRDNGLTCGENQRKTSIVQLVQEKINWKWNYNLILAECYHRSSRTRYSWEKTYIIFRAGLRYHGTPEWWIVRPTFYQNILVSINKGVQVNIPYPMAGISNWDILST